MPAVRNAGEIHHTEVVHEEPTTSDPSVQPGDVRPETRPKGTHLGITALDRPEVEAEASSVKTLPPRRKSRKAALHAASI